MSILATSTPIVRRRDTDWTCWRCGREYTNSKPNALLLCVDCRSVERPSPKVQQSRPVPSGRDDLEQPCRAWLRGFDDLDHPIHSDCVEPTHIEGVDV